MVKLIELKRVWARARAHKIDRSLAREGREWARELRDLARLAEQYQAQYEALDGSPR